MQADGENTGPILEVEGLCKTYGTMRAVAEVSFTVEKGEIFGILGPNGAGKTTTLEILEGRRVPDGGRVAVNGIDVGRDPRSIKHLIGVQLQPSAFFENLRLTELLDVFASLYHRRVDARTLLERVELEEKAKSYFSHLSGGQKQRFSIAVALVNDPLILFLDEPTTGLDPQARRHMWELIKSLRCTGKTIVLTTHNMEEAEELCNRVLIMDKGRIIALNTSDALVDALLAKGFHQRQVERFANLEDVFLDLTGRDLRDG